MSFLVKITHTLELTIEHYFVSICLSLRDRMNTDAKVQIHAQCPESVIAAQEILKMLQDEFPQNSSTINQQGDKLMEISFKVHCFENTRASITILGKYLDNLVIFQRKLKKDRNKENKQNKRKQKQAELSQNDPDFNNEGLNGFNALRSLSDDLTEIQVTIKENPQKSNQLDIQTIKQDKQSQHHQQQRQSLKEFQQNAQKKQIEKNHKAKQNEKKNKGGIKKNYNPQDESPYVPKSDVLHYRAERNEGTRAKQGEIRYPQEVEVRDGVKMYRGGKQQSNCTRDHVNDNSDSEYYEALKNVKTRGQQR